MIIKSNNSWHNLFDIFGLYKLVWFPNIFFLPHKTSTFDTIFHQLFFYTRNYVSPLKIDVILFLLKTCFISKLKQFFLKFKIIINNSCKLWSYCILLVLKRLLIRSFAEFFKSHFFLCILSWVSFRCNLLWDWT
jgi:hypothetical protein